MGTYEQLKAAVAAVIHDNGAEEITGDVMQQVLITLINSLGAGATFAGVAVPTTNPSSPDAKMFYLAGKAGTYTNFNLTITKGLWVFENTTGSWVGHDLEVSMLFASGQDVTSTNIAATYAGAGNSDLVTVGAMDEALAGIVGSVALSALDSTRTAGLYRVLGVQSRVVGYLQVNMSLSGTYVIQFLASDISDFDDGYNADYKGHILTRSYNVSAGTWSAWDEYGGGKFASGEKVADVSIAQTLGNSQTSVASQKAVTDAIYNLIDIANIDAMKNDATLRTGGTLARYTATTTLQGVTYKVGILDVMSDSAGHVLTQILTTHYTITSGVLDTSSHSDGAVRQYYRSVKINGGTLPTMDWTLWKPINDEQLDVLSASVDAVKASVGYYVCDTVSGTAAKVVSATGYELATGGCIRIKMDNANTADSVTLNINSTGAKALYYGGAQASSTNSWEAGEVLEVYYDGTQYQCASGGGGTAEKIKYSNSVSGIQATNVQEAVDELSESLDDIDGKFDALEGYQEKELEFSNVGRWTGYNTKNSDTYYACTPIVDIESYTKLMYRTSINGTNQTIIFLFDSEGQTIATIKNTVSNNTDYGIIDLTIPAYSGVKYIAINCRSADVFHMARLFIPMNSTEIEMRKMEVNLHGAVEIPYVPNMVFGPSGGVSKVNNTAASDYQDIAGYDRMDYTGNGSGGHACVLFFDDTLTIISSLTIAQNSTVSGTIDFTQPEYSDVKYVVVSSYIDPRLGYYMRLYTESSVGDRVLRLEKADYRGTTIYAALGDSITAGQGASDGKGSWFDRFLARFGNTVSFKYATSGRTIRTFVDEANPTQMATVHTCFVMGGTNWVDGSEIGQLSDAPTPPAWQPNTAYAVGDRCIGGRRMAANRAYVYEDMYECIVAGTSSDNADASNFTHTAGATQVDGTVTWQYIGCPSWYADLWKTYNTLTGWNPAMRVIFMSPIRQKTDINKEPSQCTRYAAIEALKNFCYYNSLEYIDMREKMPINANTVSALLGDQWHPTNAGYEIMCDVVSANV